MKKRLLAWILALMMLITLLPATVLADDAVVSPVDGVYLVSNEKELRYALFKAATDGTVTTIKLTDNITLEMLYAAANLPTSDVIQDNETGDTFNRYKTGVHPTAEDPTHWNSLVTDQTDEERAVYGAYYHMGATDERIARLVVKAGQNVVLDLNGYAIEKNARATHGDWSNTCTDIIGNYGKLTVTDTSTGETKGTIRGRGYTTCGGAVLHNYEGATMTVRAVNVDGNAAGMTAGTGQYVIANDGGKTVIDGANIFDTATSASLVVITAGEMEITGGAILTHPNTKNVNAKGGIVTIEDATIASDKYPIFATGSSTVVTVKNDVTFTGTGKLTVEKQATITADSADNMPTPEGYEWREIDGKLTLAQAYVAKIGDTGYTTFGAAFAEAVDGDTITLLADCSGNGIIAPTGKFGTKGLTVDFNGFTYTVSGTLVGSKNTETLGFQLLKDNKITFKNGTITNDLNCQAGSTTPTWTASYPAILIQNYCNLTLQNMTVTPVGGTSYTMSNNCGDVVIEDSTINTVNGGVAFDVYGGFGNYSDVTVTVKGESKINGKVEVARSSGTQNENKLVLEGGTINGDVTVEDKAKTAVAISGGSITGSLDVAGTDKATVEISGGSFSESVWEYVVPALNAELKSGDRYSYYEDVNAAIAAAKPGDQVSTRPSDSGDAPAATCSVTLKDGDAEETVITVEKNTQITLPTLTKDGYTFLGWKLDGKLYTGSYTVTADVTFTAVWKNNSALPNWITALPALDGSKKLPFTDVWRGDWYYDGVRYVFDNDLMNGTSGTVFSPNADTTRGMIVTILARMDGVNTSGTPWYEAGREWAMRNGISDGTNMEGKITREQLAAMLSRYAALKNRDVSAIASISAYADASSVSSWAVNAMRWAVGEGLIQGSNNHLRPQSNATRAEVATILMRFCELLKK